MKLKFKRKKESCRCLTFFLLFCLEKNSVRSMLLFTSFYTNFFHVLREAKKAAEWSILQVVFFSSLSVLAHQIHQIHCYFFRRRHRCFFLCFSRAIPRKLFCSEWRIRKKHAMTNFSVWQLFQFIFIHMKSSRSDFKTLKATASQN